MEGGGGRNGRGREGKEGREGEEGWEEGGERVHRLTCRTWRILHQAVFCGTRMPKGFLKTKLPQQRRQDQAGMASEGWAPAGHWAR